MQVGGTGKIMETSYALKVQAIRSKGQRPRLYAYLPAALAEAIDLQPGEDVRWELLDRGELHLVRDHTPRPRATQRARNP
jgi:hypothetical protein